VRCRLLLSPGVRNARRYIHFRRSCGRNPIRASSISGSQGDILSDRAGLRDNLVLGRRELSARFRRSPPRILRAGESLITAAQSRDVIYRLHEGWACQFRDFSDGGQAIIDIYLPGDVIGLDAVLRTRLLEEVATLTSITAEAIDAEDALTDLITYPPTALYIAWLLSQRQQRADRLLAAISCLDARGRLATIVLDLYTRLRRKKLITGSTYNLPLTQIQIGSYLGLTVVHVNRMLRSLRADRIVNLEKHSVTIFDLERLRGLAQNGDVVSPVSRAGERSPIESASSIRQVTGLRAEAVLRRKGGRSTVPATAATKAIRDDPPLATRP
jgi:CRP/FNR family transcriptional regulator